MKKIKDYLLDNEKRKSILFIITIFICCINMIYWINQKEGLQIDEIFSYGSASYSYSDVYKARSEYFEKNIYGNNIFETITNIIHYFSDNREKSHDEIYKMITEDPKWQTKEDAKGFFTISKDEILNFIPSYMNQVVDVHPPLFYFVVHIVLSICLNTFSKYIIFAINLLFFIGICILLKKIVVLYNRDYLAIPIVLLYGLSMGAVSTIIFLRMYAMLTFFCMLYLYINLLIIKNDFKTNKTLNIAIVITTILGFLTQYYFCLFAISVFVLMIIKMLICKNYKDAIQYTLSHIISAIIGIVIFVPSIFHIFFSYRGISSVDGSKNLFRQIIRFLNTLFNAYSIPFIIGISVFIFEFIYYLVRLILKIKNKETDNIINYLVLALPAFLFLVVASVVSPYNHIRYLMPILPVISFMFFLLIDEMMEYINKYVRYSIFYLLVVIVSAIGFITNEPIFLYRGYNQCFEIAEQYKEYDCVYICDNSFTYNGFLPELMIFNKTLKLDVNKSDFNIIKEDEELKNKDSFILLIQPEINDYKVMEKLKEVYGEVDIRELLNLRNGYMTPVYLVNKHN